MRYHHDVCVIGKCLFETSEEHFLDFQHRWHSGSRPTRALPSRNVLYTVSLHKFKTACLFTVIRVRWWDHLLLTLFDLSKPRLILTFAGESIEWIDIEAFVRQFWSITDYQSWGISKIYFNLLRYIFTSPVNLDFFCLQILLQEEELCSQFSRILFISLSMIPSFMSLNLNFEAIAEKMFSWSNWSMFLLSGCSSGHLFHSAPSLQKSHALLWKHCWIRAWAQDSAPDQESVTKWKIIEYVVETFRFGSFIFAFNPYTKNYFQRFNCNDIHGFW